MPNKTARHGSNISYARWLVEFAAPQGFSSREYVFLAGAPNEWSPHTSSTTTLPSSPAMRHLQNSTASWMRTNTNSRPAWQDSFLRSPEELPKLTGEMVKLCRLVCRAHV